MRSLLIALLIPLASAQNFAEMNIEKIGKGFQFTEGPAYGPDRCVYFSDIGKKSLKRNQASIKVSEKVQDEDVAICDAVQKGLASRAYVAGRLSVRREAGEHLFHRLLHADLTRGMARQENSAAD